MIKKRKYPYTYALYRGDELLAVGTVKEIARQLNKAEQTIRHYASPYYQNMTRKYETTLINKLIKIEDDDEDEVF